MAPLNAFPWVLNGFVEAIISCNRLDQYLESGPKTKAAKEPFRSTTESEESYCIMDSGTYSWTEEEDDNTMVIKKCMLLVTSPKYSERISLLLLARQKLEVEAPIIACLGESLVVQGSIATGKSSLLCAIAGELYHLHKASPLAQEIGGKPLFTSARCGSERSTVAFSDKVNGSRVVKSKVTGTLDRNPGLCAAASRTMYFLDPQEMMFSFTKSAAHVA